MTTGAIDSGRLQQRRQVSSFSLSHGDAGPRGMGGGDLSARSHLEMENTEGYDEDEEEEDWKKDA